MKDEIQKSEITFLDDIKHIIQKGQKAAYGTVSAVMTETYWNIGKRIVEQEQQGKERAEYGKHLIEMLSEELKKEFGKNFSKRNLFYYKKFYLYFPDWQIVNASVHNLTWTHYRALLRVSDENARLWYLKESNEQVWNSRTLDRNIATQYYYRLLQSPKKEKVAAEMKQKTAERNFQITARRAGVKFDCEPTNPLAWLCGQIGYIGILAKPDALISKPTVLAHCG